MRWMEKRFSPAEADLKREFGRDLTFWDGAVGAQNVLQTGRAQDVKNDARRRIEDLAPGGGFVFAPIHNIQHGVPPGNVVAMWETLHECGNYQKESAA